MPTIIDAHCHLAGEELSADGLIEAMDRDGIARAILMAKTVPFCPPMPPGAHPAAPFALRGPLAPLGRRAYGRVVRGSQVRLGAQWVEVLREPDNDEVAAAVGRHPHRLMGMVHLNPAAGDDSMKTLRYFVEQKRFIGVKIHAWWHNVDMALELTEVAEYCQKHRLLILIHLGARPETANVEGLLRSFPELAVILAHGGAPYFDRLWPLVRHYDTLFADLSGDCVTPRLAAKIVRKIGPSKAVFGSDGPYSMRQRTLGESPYRHSFSRAVAKVDALPVSGHDKDKIFSENLLRILGQNAPQAALP